tara:strand:- start:7 stop:729 length:723 start_codon:yes stop_codon:yes gene_type:complete
MENTLNKFDPKLIEKLFLDSAVEISLSSFIISLVTAAILSYFIKRSYISNSQSLSNKDYFSDVFIPLSVITCLVISVVKFSLALSLGLVGALSIVRFRAAIKEPEELVYLFFCVGVGIATGANQIIIATASTLVIIFILYIQSRFKRSKEKENINFGSNNILKVNIINKKTSVEDIIKKYEKFTNYLNLKSSFFEKNLSQHIFWVEFKNKKSYIECLKMSETLPDKGVEISFYSNSKIIE